MMFPHCLAPGCRRLALRRGLCLPCYERLRREVQAGRLTWLQAEAQGLAAPANKAARRRWGLGKG